MSLYSRGRSLGSVDKVCKKLLCKVTGDDVVGLFGRVVGSFEVEGGECVVDLRGPGWLFLLGQCLGNGTQLVFPRLVFYLCGANKRQQRGLFGLEVKMLLKSRVMETKVKSVSKERIGLMTWEK